MQQDHWGSASSPLISGTFGKFELWPSKQKMSRRTNLRFVRMSFQAEMGSFFHGLLCTSWATWGGESEPGDNMRAMEEPNPE